jgi:hypothetical protein
MDILTKIRTFALWIRRRPVDAMETKADEVAVQIDQENASEATEADARFLHYVTTSLSDIVGSHCEAMVQPASMEHLPKLAADLTTLASLITIRMEG